MKTLKSLFPEIFGGIASGLLIAIGGTVLLSVEDRALGAVLFSVALLSICMLDLFLYTGKIGFVAESFEKKTALRLFVGLLANFVGASFGGYAIRFARPTIIEKAQEACAVRLDNGILRSFVLGCFCGMLMYVAVKIYRAKNSIAGIVFCIPVFILSGFEHSIADMFYFALAGMIDFAYLGFIIAVIFGNSVGAILIAWLCRMKAPPKN